MVETSTMIVVGRQAAESVRNQAEALAVGLEAGALSVADAVAWADMVIAAEPAPAANVCEIATMARCTTQEVVDALRTVPGPCDRAVAEVLVVWRLARSLTADRSNATSIASALYKLALAGVVRDEGLRHAIRSYSQQKDEALYRDMPGYVDLAAGKLSDAIQDFVERTASLLDPPEGPALPWLTSKV